MFEPTGRDIDNLSAVPDDISLVQEVLVGRIPGSKMDCAMILLNMCRVLSEIAVRVIKEEA